MKRSAVTLDMRERFFGVMYTLKQAGLHSTTLFTYIPFKLDIQRKTMVMKQPAALQSISVELQLSKTFFLCTCCMEAPKRSKLLISFSQYLLVAIPPRHPPPPLSNSKCTFNSALTSYSSQSILCCTATPPCIFPFPFTKISIQNLNGFR